MKRVAEDKAIVAVPPVRRLRVVGVQPPFVRVVIDVEDVRVAVGIGYVRDAIRATGPGMLSGLNRIRHL